jgi:TRAP transporter 4TM/12TM fusion protein
VRKLTGRPAFVLGGLAVAMSVYHLYVRLTPAAPDSIVLRIMTLVFSLVLAFFLFPWRKGATPDRVPWMDLVFGALSIAVTGYLLLNYRYVSERMPTAEPLTPMAFAVGIAAIMLTLEATRRSIGPSLPIVALAFIVYGLAGPWMPGFLRHRGVTLEVLIDQTYYTTEGIFGIALSVAGSYVILFVIFGAFLEKSGAGQFFMNFANAIAGGARGGPGKVSVVSSSLFGTISGSAVANVMVDGWLTIPMMKRTGFKAEAAAAIESVASTGGQIMPPVMGAASFVMAEFMGVPYSHVMLAALIPALFYYGALFAAIHFNAMRTGLRGIPKNELPRLGDVMLRQGHLFLPLLVIFGLLIDGFTATYAAVLATAVVLYCWLLETWGWPFVGVAAVLWVVDLHSWLWALAVVGILLIGLRPDGWRRLWQLLIRDVPVALRDGANQTVPVAMATASAGIVVGIVLQTGLAIRFTGFLVDVASGTLMLALIITMLAAIVLGTGMPTTPAYIMLAALLIPAIVKLGVAPMAAHMFAFYFACLSAVTPPVALAVYAAASISRCSLWGAGLQAVKFAAAGFIVPFFFVYSPALLFAGSWTEILRAVVTGTIGVIALAAALEGQLIRPATWLERGLFMAAALMLIDPGFTTDVIGLGVLLFGLAIQKLRSPVAVVPVPATDAATVATDPAAPRV